MTESKKKLEKAEDFIGWKSDDGNLEVIGIAAETGKNGRKLFKITCKICSQDPELFPLGYFISQKRTFMNGNKPCGCSSSPRWEDWQYLILARRAGEGRFIVHGFAEEFHGQNTKLDCECSIDGIKWTPTVSNIIHNNSRGCPKCANVYRPNEIEALNICTDICTVLDYRAIGFQEGYVNCYSKFEYICPKHGKKIVSYYAFVQKGNRCMECFKESQKEINSKFFGYYPERKDEQDFLYVLDFNDKFIKVGRSFDVDERIKSLRTASKILKDKIHKLRIFTATHEEIYDLEQDLHSELRERNFQHYVDWSTECFENDSLYILNKMLDKCGLEEVTL